MRHISITAESLPLKTPFRIARGEKRTAEVIVVEIYDGDYKGRGEAVPYARYGETIETVSATIEQISPAFEKGMTQKDMQTALMPGAARCALDCALWDLRAKQAHKPVWALAGLAPPHVTQTAYTISLDTPQAMARAVETAAAYPLLKLKLGGKDGIKGDMARLHAIRAVAPHKRLIVDVNEGWSCDDLAHHADALAPFNLELIEQPVPSGEDKALARFNLPFCADESLHDCESFPHIDAGYNCINIKLDKAGGLSEAIALVDMAKKADKKIMLGCMVASSLAMAPALLLAHYADYVDLDGPLWLARDRENGLQFEGALIHPPTPALWGA